MDDYGLRTEEELTMDNADILRSRIVSKDLGFRNVRIYLKIVLSGLIGFTMKHKPTIIYLTLFIFLSTNIKSQITNSGFEEWELVEELATGHSYVDPIGWKSNNYFTFFFEVSMPVTRSINAHDGLYSVRLESNGKGLDSTTPGVIGQIFPTENLKAINYYMWCDSIDREGSCLTEIIAPPYNILYSDSIKTSSEDYEYYSIDIPDAWRNEYDSLEIRFTADGTIFALEPDKDGHAIMYVDDISVDFISNTKELINDELLIFPIPTTSILNIKYYGKVGKCILYDLNGQKLLEQTGKTKLDLSFLDPGIYLLSVQTRNGYYNERVMKLD